MASVKRKTVADFPDLVAQWHPTKNADLTPAQVSAGSKRKVWWKCPEGPDHEWAAQIANRTGKGRNGCRACAGYQVSVTNSLAALFPAVAKQWHPTRNGDLTPDKVVAGSSKKVWWKCPEGPDHEWPASPNSRTGRGTGCPACAGQQVSVTNSLAALYPALAAQWHPTKNGDLTPAQVVTGSQKKAWWKCPEGPDHEWPASAEKRASTGQGCPFCRGRRVSVTNSLASLYPEVAAQWHPSKNGDLTPRDVTAGTEKKVWWKCPEGPDHEWPATPAHRSGVRTRSTGGTGCPACGGKQVSVTNSLASLFPGLVGQWHTARNGELTPDQVVAGSHKKVWWKCPEGEDHEWPAPPNARTSGSGCPACAGRQVSVTNSLAALHPDLAVEWHTSRNGDLTPDQVVAGSNKKVWWSCAKGPDHEWPASSNARTSGRGCPMCRGLQVSVTNSLDSLHPSIAAQWHPTRNGATTPDQVVAGSGKKAWWKCPEGPDHEWPAVVANRTSGTGCPACAGKQVSVTNRLDLLHPDLAVEWHTTKNGSLTPDRVTAGSHKSYWWKCPEGHAWPAAVVNRTRLASGCPVCNVGWSEAPVRAFVESLLPHLEAFNSAELFLIFQQSGLLATIGRARSFVKALVTGRFPRNELEAWVAGEESLPDRFFDDRDLALEDVEGGDDVGAPVVPVGDDPEAPDDHDLPVVQAKDALAALEHAVIASSDEEAVEFLLASAKAKLWRHAYLDAQQAAEQARAFVGGEYPDQARQAFLAELDAAQQLQVPEEYAFKIDGQLAPPNLMQRVVAVRVRDGRRFGNWSGTGAGKTLSAILSTRVVGAKLTVICCPNAVVENWSREVARVFPDSEVAAKTWTPAWTTSGPRYLVLNYEMFQQGTSEGALKRFLDASEVDFIVIDEVHYAKQRHVENMSRRKKLMMALVAAAGEANPDLRVLGLSATPVINNLQEGRSLVEMITGVEHEDLETRATVSNCMRLHQKLVTLGTRWMPDYTRGGRQLEVRHVEINCEEFLEQIRALPKGASPLELEKLLTQARLPAILAELKRGRRTLIYTHYVEGIDKLLSDAIRDAGLTVGFYTGVDKSGLLPFLDGTLDVLVGSSSIGTGVDGLQHVCDHLVVNVLPWTNAEFEQLKGRIWRQGQESKRVEVVIPVTYADVAGERWSYCESKLRRLQYKKSIADAAVDGVVPEGSLRTPAQAQRDLIAWLERLASGESEPIIRRRITVPLSDEPGEVTRRLASYGDFSAMNNRWNHSRSGTLAERLAADPEEWEQYHTLYRAARESWTVVPYMEVARWLQKREGLTVADFGCGEALLAAEVGDRHVIHSLDHVAINETVLAGDMAHTPLDDESVDLAVFSLSLMGANCTDYLREAHRVLALDGRLHIWEATSRFDDPQRFGQDLQRLGFGTFLTEQRGPFTHIEAMKLDVTPDTEFHLRFRSQGEASP